MKGPRIDERTVKGLHPKGTAPKTHPGEGERFRVESRREDPLAGTVELMCASADPVDGGKCLLCPHLRDW